LYDEQLRLKEPTKNGTAISWADADKEIGQKLKDFREAGKQVVLLPQAKMVSSGVVHMIQRQEEGWSYIRP
jgi:hypothetical protein